MVTLLQELLGWAYVLVAAAGAVVSGLNLGRSRWAGLLAVAFGAEATVSAFYRVALLFSKSGVFSMSGLGAAYLIVSMLGLAASVAMVAGVAGLLSELQRHSGSAGS